MWLLAVMFSALIGTHGIAYWDAGDYVLLAINGEKSGLLLGRPLFLWVSRLIVSTGIDLEIVEPVLRWFWCAFGALAAPALTVLAMRLGLPYRSAWAAGVALALSPTFAHTAHQVLTDAPALALSIFALISAAAGRAIPAGLLLAAAVATRETAALHVVPILILLDRRQALLAFGTFAAALGLVIAVNQPPGMLSWMGSMSSSISGHGWGIRDVLISLGWILAAGPVPVALGAIALFRREPMPPRVRQVAVPAVLATALLALYPDGSFSPRYVLAAVPIGFFLLAAPRLAAKPLMTAVALLIPIIVAAPIAFGAVSTTLDGSGTLARRGETLTGRIPQLPGNAVVVPGHFCPQARLAAVLAKRDDFGFVCPGWGWPPDLHVTLDEALGAGRPVAIDVSDTAWVGRREAALREIARSWAARYRGTETAGFLVVRPN